jgi:hypothetical protein
MQTNINSCLDEARMCQLADFSRRDATEKRFGGLDNNHVHAKAPSGSSDFQPDEPAPYYRNAVVRQHVRTETSRIVECPERVNASRIRTLDVEIPTSAARGEYELAEVNSLTRIKRR